MKAFEKINNYGSNPGSPRKIKTSFQEEEDVGETSVVARNFLQVKMKKLFSLFSNCFVL